MRRIISIGFVTLAVTLLATSASALPTTRVANPVAFPPVYTLATYGLCAGTVNSSVNGQAYPNTAAFTVNTNLYGFGDCGVTVRLTWRNTATGVTGVKDVSAHGPGFWSNGKGSAHFTPGPGHYVGTLSVFAPHFPQPAPIEFNVPTYGG